jgi:hypothetical protein
VTTPATGIYYRVGTGDGGSVTFPLSAKKSWVLELLEISGMRTIGPLDQVAKASSGSLTSTTIDSGTTPSTRLPGDAVVAALYDDASTPGGLPSNGFGFLDAGSSGSKDWTGVAFRVATQLGPQETSSLLAGAAHVRGCIAAFGAA